MLGTNGDVVVRDGKFRAYVETIGFDLGTIETPAVEAVLREICSCPIARRLDADAAVALETIVQDRGLTLAFGFEQAVAGEHRPVRALTETAFLATLFIACGDAVAAAQFTTHFDEAEILLGARCELAHAVAIFIRIAVHMDVGGKDSDVARDAAIDGTAELVSVVAEPACLGDAADVAAVLQHVDGVAGAEPDRTADRAEARGRFARAGLDVHGFQDFGLDRHTADMMEQRAALRRAVDGDVEQRILKPADIDFLREPDAAAD